MELSLEEMRTEMTFAELAILHELVYNEIDEENKKKRASDQMKTLEKVYFNIQYIVPNVPVHKSHLEFA